MLSSILYPLRYQVDIYSFDIFDTIFCRRIDPPESLHVVLSQYIANKIGGGISGEEVLSVRYEEEKKLRTKAVEDGFDYECHYDDIIRNMVKRLIGNEDNDLISWIYEKEIKMEINALVVKNGVLDMLDTIRNFGKKIILISDMYLGHEEIEVLLKHKGILKYIDRIFVSSETLHCKYSGRMFRDVIEYFNVEPGRFVHSGDNVFADFKIPHKLGMNAVHLKEGKENHRKTLLARYNIMGRRRNYWKGRHLLQVTSCEHQKLSTNYDEFYYRYGYEVMGPILSLYTHGVIKHIKEKRINRAYFLARDGYLLQKIFNLMLAEIAPDLVGSVSDSYIHLSRQSVAPAALCKGMNCQQALLALYNPKQQGLKSILNSYSINHLDFIKLAAKHGFSQIDKPIFDWNDARLCDFINDDEVVQRIKKHSVEHQKVLKDYLTQHEFFCGEKVAFIDIGWNGTIQNFISTAFGDRSDYPETHGLYFGYCKGIPYEFSDKDFLEGIFYDERRGVVTERIVGEFEELFEESCRASQATTIGYGRGANNRVHPIFKARESSDRQVEIECDKYIQKIQEGILSFVPKYLEAIELTGYSFEEIKPFILTLTERAVSFPRREEMIQLTKLVHTEDWGQDSIMDLNDVKKTISWRNLRSAVRESNWRSGTVLQKTGGVGVGLFRLLNVLRSV